MSEYDTLFSLPAVDDDPDTEIGVLLMGLSAERLLAGLGVACLDPALEPATVTLLVDQLRHDVRTDLTFADAVAEGAWRWHRAREGLAEANLEPGPRSADLRRMWKRATGTITVAVDPRLRTASGAERVYLVACWLRCVEITEIAEERCPT
jgi:Family of unknown function (DUF6187)